MKKKIGKGKGIEKATEKKSIDLHVFAFDKCRFYQMD